MMDAERVLRSHGALGAALLSVAIVWFTWDAVSPIPKVHDETSYLLQARIFATGRWTAPAPPIPEFFEQPHVIVSPVLASKYPPGHALLLSPGVLVGFPPLVPLLLTAATAALLFALTSRLATAGTALLAWAVWITAPIVLRFQPSYFSELTTTALTLAAWWTLLEWRATRRRGWLLLMAAAIGWGAITRPLTMLALAIPLGIVVLRDVARLRLWRELTLAVAVGSAVLAVLPLWSARTTGSWSDTPLALYRRQYLPYDRMGFTPDTTAPTMSLSPAMQQTYDYFMVPHVEQRLAALPRTIADRAVQLAVAFFRGWRLPLLLLAIAGLITGGTALRFASASAALLLVAHLPYAYYAPWTVYYLETAPVLAALVAFGIRAAVARWAPQRIDTSIPFALASVMVLAMGVGEIARWRADHRLRAAFDRRFADAIATLPKPAIVFMQYSPRFTQHVSVVFNHPDLSRVPVWVVHDLGARNAELRARAPDRSSFDFEEEQLVGGARR